MPRAKYRASRKALGLCPQCGKTNDRHPKSKCSACLEKHGIQSIGMRKRRLENGFCGTCGRIKDDPYKYNCLNCQILNTEIIALRKSL